MLKSTLKAAKLTRAVEYFAINQTEKRKGVQRIAD